MILVSLAIVVEQQIREVERMLVGFHENMDVGKFINRDIKNNISNEFKPRNGLSRVLKPLLSVSIRSSVSRNPQRNYKSASDRNS